MKWLFSGDFTCWHTCLSSSSVVSNFGPEREQIGFVAQPVVALYDGNCASYRHALQRKRISMRCFLLAGILAVLAVGASQSSAQQMAIPTTVNGLIKSPPKVGQLIQVSGYLVTTDKQPKLQDTDSGRKINLDFSRSQVTLDKLGATEAKSSPVMIIGRLQDSKDNGKPTIIVVGAINLTP